MATINLGSIKFNWQGAYNGATAYAVDDVVSYNGSSYVCILASTGNLPTNATYFEQMSSAGTNGTDGTDLTTTLTTQGDIVYRDASGLARLPAGSANQVLQSGGTGANPSWGTVSSDYVKLAGVDLSGSTATSYDFTQFMDDSVYRSYDIKIVQKLGGSDYMLMRFLNNTTPYTGSTDYRYAGFTAYRQIDNANPTLSLNADSDGRDSVVLSSWNSNTSYLVNYHISIMGKPTGTSDNVGWLVHSMGRDTSGTSYVWHDEAMGFIQNNGSIDGVRIYTNAGNTLNNTEFTIYGVKK